MLKARWMSPLALLSLSSVMSRAEPIEIREGFAVGQVVRGGRVPVPTDLIQFQRARQDFKVPIEGLIVPVPTGSSPAWQAVSAGENGVFQGQNLVGAYLYSEVEVPQAGAYWLEAAGHGMVYVNDEPRAGDIYSYGWLRLPVQLKAGKNSFLFAIARGQLKARLVPVEKAIDLDLGDPTLPDPLTSSDGDLFGAVVVRNATSENLTNLVLSARLGSSVARVTPLPAIPAWSVRKVGFTFAATRPAAAEQTLSLELARSTDRERETLDRRTIPLQVKEPLATHKRTFVSEIDGSVQYFSVVPAQKPSTDNALILSLHGASVEATSQAAAYQAKDWGTILCPTNRRPFGFDWEEIGRKDGLEVWRIGQKAFAHDPARTVVTGHSMGGHGTWHLGLTHPGKFAAVGPSAGWVSFFSYAGGQRRLGDDPVAQLLERANNPSDTLQLVRNTLGQRLFILHGDADDNVPVREARTMREALRTFHPDLTYHEQAGAGHWWGNECMDWPAMFEVFKNARLPDPATTERITFSTANPTIEGQRGWITVEQAQIPMSFARFDARRRGTSWVVNTENVAVITLDLKGMTPGTTISLDGTQIRVPRPSRPMTYQWREGVWASRPAPEGVEKRAGFGGPFKEVLDKRFVMVVGTTGTPEETAWNWQTARYHAESFYYRGNGSVDIVRDRDFDPKRYRGRNVLLYGHAQSNGSWAQMLSGSPLQVRRERVTVGRRSVEGPELATLFIQPRQDSPGNLVGVIAGTGVAGNRMAERLLIWTSGVAFPDWIVIGAEGLALGLEGVRGAGFFNAQWGLEGGDAAWRPIRTEPRPRSGGG
ncbi:MAG TPA: prolyl oligopeptidase family serine peptidase [Fimbriimonadaceae bacterium]|nr:prolyl oligopeptidase family serine peptidase [Fimbriimonadaceae bacterium]HRJ32915.1 prolyl oligopeptidase family serine peptidase [Fimbriimonadaceae bacterium]